MLDHMTFRVRVIAVTKKFYEAELALRAASAAPREGRTCTRFANSTLLRKQHRAD
jgi:catechol 2,3-dioxygenase-like lactoylglutathione lyase family enzyme